MFQRILVASDLTPQSLSALRLARGLGDTFGGKLTVAHVVSMPSELRRWRGSVFRDDLKAYQAVLERQTQAASTELDRQVTTVGLASTRGVRLVVRSGAPAAVLAELVEEFDSDLVIVARGSGGKLGPVAEQLVRLVGRTVLVAPVRGKRAATIGLPGARPPTRSRRRAVA
jgi:nucleotide-binding universal stress UspA family protein